MVNPCYAIQIGKNEFADSGWYFVVATSERNAELKLADILGARVNGRISHKALNIVATQVHLKRVVY